MKRLIFKCTLLTDVIISANTSTEGEHQSLNFIPGSNFLGILATAIYNDNLEDSYSLFHSGKVRFSDAHIVINNSRSFQIPFSWYYPKGGKLTDGENYMLNFMSNKNFTEIVNKGIQLKQARDGYFTEDILTGKYLSFVKTYSQKTAYNPVLRRAAESEMFGYEALQEGSEWLFYIDIDEDVKFDSKQFKKLEGSKPLARSKNAEFGSVKIELVDEFKIVTNVIIPREVKLENKSVQDGVVSYEVKSHKLVLLYAESRLAFRNEFGQPTFTPSPKQLGLPEDAEVLWDRSQIRTGVYAPWNKKRWSRDEDRVFIEKGSVFVVDFEKVIGTCTSEIIRKGVGLYRAEGFGQLLVNPDFLLFEPTTGKLKLQLESVQDRELFGAESYSQNELLQDDELIGWIEQNYDVKAEVLEKVDDFIFNHAKQFSEVSNSQWGEIRSFAQSAKDKTDLISCLFEPTENKGYLMHGVGLTQWSEGKTLLEDSIKYADDKVVLSFVEKLAARMQKKGGAK